MSGCDRIPVSLVTGQIISQLVRGAPGRVVELVASPGNAAPILVDVIGLLQPVSLEPGVRLTQISVSASSLRPTIGAGDVLYAVVEVTP